MNSSLGGLRVLNTRPIKQAQLLSEQIHHAGGLAIECPLLEIRPTHQQWIEKLVNLQEVKQAIFISANAVNYCFEGLAQAGYSWPSKIHVIAVGQGTADALIAHNIAVHDIPTEPDSEHLLQLQCLQDISQQTLLLVKGVGGRALIEDALKIRKAHTHTLEVYERVLPFLSSQFIKSLWRDDAVDIILLTSEQAIDHCFRLFGQEAHHWLKGKPHLVISQRLAKAARTYGIKQIIISHPNKLLDALLNYKGSLYDR